MLVGRPPHRSETLAPHDSAPARDAGRSLAARVFAVAAGLLTHALFLLAVVLMALSLRGGMRAGLAPFSGTTALVVNICLLLQFPLVHSLLLGRRGSRVLTRFIPFGVGRDLSTTTYVASAALQLALCFGLWSPTGSRQWAPEGTVLVVWTGVYVASWLVLLKAMKDAGLEIQTGSLGWTSIARNLRPHYRPFPEGGLFRACRQPVYMAFAAILWTGPIWTVDHALIATVWTGYCFLGPLHKERRYLARYGEAFERYRERVPYVWPRRPRRPTSSPAGEPSA